MRTKALTRSKNSETLQQQSENHDSPVSLLSQELTAFGNYTYSRSPLQRQEADDIPQENNPSLQRYATKRNDTGLPDNLKTGIESLSGMSMDGVKVHYNSSRPAQLNALAYAQGRNIHLGPGQEQHLPHEAWHVVQQAQGRVKPTMQMKNSVSINDNQALEQEADVMGAQAIKAAPTAVFQEPMPCLSGRPAIAVNGSAYADSTHGPIQRVVRIGKHRLKSRKNVSQLARGHKVDEILNLNEEQKTKFLNELVLLAQARNNFNFETWQEAWDFLDEQHVLISGNDGVASIIRNVTDLLVWLGSYPLDSGKRIGSFAESAVLEQTLESLEAYTKPISNAVVWRKVERAVNKQKNLDLDDKWGQLELADSYDLLGQVDEASVPARYRRKLPEEVYEEELEKLRKSLTGYKFVGVHATTLENTGSLVKEGVSQERFGTGHGVGKGNGFYIIPANAISPKLIKSAKGWGGHVLAVYLPDNAEEQSASAGDNVQTLEKKNKKKKPRYYKFGKEESVIPPALCPKVKLVVDPADISMGNTQYEAETYDNEFTFLEEL